jgi:hypothetical protein
MEARLHVEHNFILVSFLFYSAEEIVPGDGIENWLEFIKASKKLAMKTTLPASSALPS